MLVGKDTNATFVKYLSNPYYLGPERDTKLYKFMSLKNVPSARSIKLIKQAVRKLGRSNPEEL